MQSYAHVSSIMRFLFALLDSLAKRVCRGGYKNVTKEQSVGIRMQRMSDVTGATKNSVIASMQSGATCLQGLRSVCIHVATPLKKAKP